MSSKSQTGLIRALGLGALIIYGVGDILGAGIYALIGKISGHAGSLILGDNYLYRLTTIRIAGLN